MELAPPRQGWVSPGGWEVTGNQRQVIRPSEATLTQKEVGTSALI